MRLETWLRMGRTHDNASHESLCSEPHAEEPEAAASIVIRAPLVELVAQLMTKIEHDAQLLRVTCDTFESHLYFRAPLDYWEYLLNMVYPVSVESPAPRVLITHSRRVDGGMVAYLLSGSSRSYIGGANAVTGACTLIVYNRHSSVVKAKR